MDMVDIHLSDIRDYAKRLRKVADLYEQLEELARRPESNLPPLLAKAGALVCEGIAERGALLVVLCDAHKSA